MIFAKMPALPDWACWPACRMSGDVRVRIRSQVTGESSPAIVTICTVRPSLTRELITVYLYSETQGWHQVKWGTGPGSSCPRRRPPPGSMTRCWCSPPGTPWPSPGHTRGRSRRRRTRCLTAGWDNEDSSSSDVTTDIILQVLSKPQAVLRFSGGKFVLKDVGSSNGTFINNFRLSQAGLESEETVIYSDDVLRCRQKSSGGGFYLKVNFVSDLALK